MSRKYEIDAASGKRLHGRRCMTEKVTLRVVGRKVERMVQYDDSHDLRWQLRQTRTGEGDVALAKAPVLGRQRKRTVEAKDRDLVVDEARETVFGDVAAISVQGIEEAPEEVVGRNVMVSWNHNLRLRDSRQEVTSFQKLVGACSLGKIAGDDHQVGVQIVDLLQEWFRERGINPPEMKVRNVDKRSHD